MDTKDICYTQSSISMCFLMERTMDARYWLDSPLRDSDTHIPATEYGGSWQLLARLPVAAHIQYQVSTAL